MLILHNSLHRLAGELIKKAWPFVERAIPKNMKDSKKRAAFHFWKAAFDSGLEGIV